MLYEPTNIIPSSLINGGVVSETDNINIEWQVNGNSSLAMFQIDIYKDDVESTFLYSTNLVSQTPVPPGNDAEYTPLPFVGKDRMGNYIPYVYYPNQAWSAVGISNGENYKFSITQFYKSKNVIISTSSALSLVAGTQYYFEFDNGDEPIYVSFICPDTSLFTEHTKIYFDVTNSIGWIRIGGGGRMFAGISFQKTETAPQEATALSGASEISQDDIFYNMRFVSQTSFTPFIARSAPEITITPIPNPLQVAEYTFTAQYSQSQDIGIVAVRWTLYREDTGEVIDDTGNIFTQVLEYSYDAFNTDVNYNIICQVLTDSGQTAHDEINFSVSYSAAEYLGDFSADCIKNEDSIYLRWDTITVIPGVATPENGYGIDNGFVNINSGATIGWNTQYSEDNTPQPLNIQTPWSVAWAGKISQPKTDFISRLQRGVLLDGNVECSAISPDGSLLVLGGTFSGYACYFNLLTGIPVFIGNLMAENNNPLTSNVYSIAFSPNGQILVIGCAGRLRIYVVDGVTLQYGGELSLPYMQIHTISFSNNGNRMVVGGRTVMVGQTVTIYQPIIYFYNVEYLGSVIFNRFAYATVSAFENNPSQSNVLCSCFNSEGDEVVVGGNFVGYTRYYVINNNSVEDKGTVDEEIYSTIENTVRCLLYNGSYLLIGGDFNYGLLMLRRKPGALVGFTLEGGDPSPAGLSLDDTITAFAMYKYDSIFIAGTINGKTIITSCDYNYGNCTVNSNAAIIAETNEAINTLVIGHENIYAGGISKGEIYEIDEKYIEDNYIPTATFVNNIYALKFYNENSSSAAAFRNNNAIIGDTNGGIYLYKMATNNSLDFVALLTISGERPDSNVKVITANPKTSEVFIGGKINNSDNYFAAIYYTYLSSFDCSVVALSNKLLLSVNCAEYSPDGTLLAVGCESGDIFIKQNENIIAYEGLEGNAILSVNFGNSNNELVAVTESTLYYFSVSTTGLLQKHAIRANADVVFCCAKFIRSNTAIMVAGSKSGTPWVGSYEVSENGITFATAISNLSGLMGQYGQAVNIALNNAGDYSIVSGNNGLKSLLISIDKDALNPVSLIQNNTDVYALETLCAVFNDTGSIVLTVGTMAESYTISSFSNTIVESSIVQINSKYTITRSGQTITFADSDNTQIASLAIPPYANGGTNYLRLFLTKSSINAYSFHKENGLLGSVLTYIDSISSNMTFEQEILSDIKIVGKQSCDFISVFNAGDSELKTLLSLSTFEPAWQSADYNAVLIANFKNSIDGGTGTISGKGYKLYRESLSSGKKISIASLPSTAYQVKDYSIVSREGYIYSLYVYDADGAFMGITTYEVPARKFKCFSLLSTIYNAADGSYRVEKEYQFSCNIQDMALSNNSNKIYAQNFTPYPTVFKSTANYASGTLQALIGFVNKKTYRYWDDAALMKELNALSTTKNTLFLRDMKGHIWEVDVGTITMTPTQKTREMQVTISLPWTQVGDAENVSIIQTPEDAGWNNDAAVLDVVLDVNVDTGELYVVYPQNYYGTTFNLEGINLTTQTPTGITPANISLNENSVTTVERGQVIAEVET